MELKLYSDLDLDTFSVLLKEISLFFRGRFVHFLCRWDGGVLVSGGGADITCFSL